jgi:hypothetical protein
MKRRILVILLLVAAALPLKAASVVTGPLSGARAYPNPWRIDKHANSSIKFDSMPAGSVIKLFTISAHEIKQLTADSSGTALWDRTNDSGEAVASGVYIYLIIDLQGNSTSGKLAIIK